MGLKSIFYIEDEPDIRDMVTLLIRNQGIEVHVFESSKEALQQAPDIQADLLVLDVMLDGIEGPEVLKQLRQLDAFQTTPCIFLTARVDGNTVRGLMELDRVSIIHKPFKLDQFIVNLQRDYERLVQT